MMTQLLQNAAYGTAMILAVVLLRRVLKDRLVPGARLALWAVCLFRLLTPAAPESALSLWGLPKLFAPEEQAAPVSAVPAYVPAPTTPAPVPAPQASPGISWETVLAVVWLAVGMVLAARYAVIWARTRRAVACAVLLDRGDPRYAFLPRYARLREGPMEGAPLTFGVVRPTVVLLPGLEVAELDCVLAHEGVHAARRHNLWHYAMALALTVHWWNPAVWLMSQLLRRDIELSCDRAALNRLGPDRRADYANALVSLATQRPGPAFCQTFGQKAAEERILSIMKFKKTSVIGVIFTLALVLAVTVAFASEPKEPEPDTIEFHGQTFSRSALSQETLDWLDWYLSLSEEGQLSVSMVPPELISSKTPVDYDAQDGEMYGSEKTGSFSSNMRFENGVLKQFTIGISALKEDLDVQVSNGSITSAVAAAILDQARSIATDDILDWTFEGDSGLTYEVLGENRTAVCYRDKDGNLIPISQSGIVSFFILPQAFGGDSPAYIEEEIEFNEMAGKLLGEGEIVYDGGQTFNGYDVHLPEFDEDGNPVDSDIIGSRFYSYELVTDPDAVSSGVVRTSSGTHDLCTAQDCVFAGAHYHDNGEVVYVHYQNPYTDPSPALSTAPDPLTAQPLAGTTAPTASCGVAGCTETRYHHHSNGQCILLDDPCPVEGCTTLGTHYHSGVCYSCNGAGHSGGHCDGSCYTYSTPSGVTSSGSTSSGTHHSESNHSGHHGNGHH